MLHLRTLGGVAIERDGVALPGGVARRRLLVLLAYVAVHGDVGVAREAVLADFWPESDQARARNSLKQSVFALRRDLGVDVFAPGAATLRIDRTRLSVDALEFADALDRDDLRAAIACYRGTFLDGVPLPGHEQLERWVDRERERFAYACARALESVATTATRDGDHPTAIAAWRRRVALDPLSAQATLGAMRALCASGDRTAALELCRAHELLVQEELGSAPDPTVRVFAEEIRDALTARTAVPGQDAASAARLALVAPTATPPAADAMRSTPESPSTRHLLDAVPHSAPPPNGAEAAPLRASPDRESPSARGAPGRTVTATRAPRRQAFTSVRLTRIGPVARSPRRPAPWRLRVVSGWRLAVAVAVLAMALPPAIIGLTVASAADREPPSSPALIAVFPFAVRGAAEPAALRDTLVGVRIAELLSVAMNGVGTWRVVPASALLADEDVASHAFLTSTQARTAARRFGAGTYILGDVVPDGGRLHLMTSMHDATGRVLAQASFETRAGGLSEASTWIVRSLLQQRLVGPGDRLARIAAGSTASLPALKAWLAGDALFRAHRYEEAAAAFARAAGADPRFALAHVRLADAADLVGDPVRAAAATARAVSLVDRLPVAERALLLARQDEHAGDVAAAERRYEALLDDVPEHAEGWFRLGALRYRANPSRGRSVREARAAFTRALALDPERVEALVYLARIASLEGRPRAADSLLTLARTTSPDTRALAVRAVRSLVGGDGVTPVGALRSLANGRDLDAQDAALRMAVAGDDPRAARGLALSLLRAAPSRELRGLALRLMAVSAASSGQWEAATRALDQLALGEPDAAVRLRASLAAVPILSRATARDRRTLSRTLAEAPRAPSASSMAPLDWWRVGLLAEVSGDASTLAHAAGRVRALAHVERAARAQSLAAGLDARAARLAGDPREALRVLDAARLPARGAFDPVVHETETADRFLRAELLHALGRDAEAVGWYASIAEGATSELPWLAPAQLRLGELAAARGDRTAALRHYRRVLAFWERCDPALQPITRTVQARVVEFERAGAPVGASSVPGSRALAR